eukprot:PhM_4_TR13616/c0_g1_i2/m.9437
MADVHRKTAMLQSNRQKYAADTKIALQKQNDALAVLRQEKDKLMKEITSVGVQPQDMESRKKGDKLRDELRLIKSKIEAESMKEAELEKSIAVMKAEQMATRSVMGGVNVTKDNHQMLDKQMKVLENRLDQALVKFNEAIAHNKKLRETIDSLRREREVFDEIYRKLERELHEKKQNMAETIEDSNKCYEARDAYVAELKTLKQQAQEEMVVFNMRLRELDNDAELAALKEQAAKAQLEQQAQSPNKAEQRRKEEEARKAAAAAAAAEAAQEDTVDYQDIADQLKEATGLQDLKMLHQKFVKAEEHNFSMYNFVNGLNKEVEDLEEEIDTLREWLHADKGDATTRKSLQALENELAKTERLATSYDEKASTIKEQLETLRTLIQDIFGRVGCTVPEELINGADVTERNMVSFLAQIEGRAAELITTYNMATLNEQIKKAQTRGEERRRRQERRAADRQTRLEAGEVVDDEDLEDEGDAGDLNTKLVASGPTVAHGTVNIQQLVVTQGLPHTGDGHGNEAEDGEDDRVLTEKEIRERIERKLAKGAEGMDKRRKNKKR